MEVKNQPCSVLFTFSTVNLHLEDIPLIPGTCHTLQADELWSSKPVLSAVHWLSHWKSWSYPLTHAAGYVVTRNGLQKHLLPAKLSHNQSSQACRMWSQEPLTVSDWAEDGWWLCILIGFWCEHLLQWPVKLMTCCNSSVSQKTVRQANPDGGTSHYNKETLQCMAYGWQTLKHSGPKAKTKRAVRLKLQDIQPPQYTPEQKARPIWMFFSQCLHAADNRLWCKDQRLIKWLWLDVTCVSLTGQAPAYKKGNKKPTAHLLRVLPS